MFPSVVSAALAENIIPAPAKTRAGESNSVEANRMKYMMDPIENVRSAYISMNMIRGSEALRLNSSVRKGG
jgi:hypothetical protein